jgi:hypothetical protein
MLVMNTIFFVLVAVNTDDLSQLFQNVSALSDNPGYNPSCGRGTISIQVLRTVPVLLNDILFVSRKPKIR